MPHKHMFVVIDNGSSRPHWKRSCHRWRPPWILQVMIPQVILLQVIDGPTQIATCVIMYKWCSTSW